jgi:hypothetical protein
MYAGCYPLEALLQATFECLYDQQCIDPTNTVQAMNISQSTRFDINTTIELIVNELMVETFSIETSYLNYFMECAPSLCQYSYIENKNIIDGLTNLISLYGGVIVICRAVAVLIIKLLQRRIRRVQPISN